MHKCSICGRSCKTVQGLRGHEQLAHPGEVEGGGASVVSSEAVQPIRPSHGAELERRFVQTLDGLDQVPQAIEEIRARVAQVESQVGENGELSDQISDIHLMLTDLMDRAEEDSEPDASQEDEVAQVAEPKRKGVFETFDEDLKETHPFLFENES